mmetsp:Transcript_93715/g.162246  ORF Transcript_93715/g.162246 Transcript_93715/m.162246 type:complete len:90 (-) Transcript_93715:187-456(-)
MYSSSWKNSPKGQAGSHGASGSAGFMGGAQSGGARQCTVYLDVSVEGNEQSRAHGIANDGAAAPISAGFDTTSGEGLATHVPYMYHEQG